MKDIRCSVLSTQARIEIVRNAVKVNKKGI